MSSNIAATMHWSDVTNVVISANSTNSVTLAADQVQGYFRLSRVVASVFDSLAQSYIAPAVVFTTGVCPGVG